MKKLLSNRIIYAVFILGVCLEIPVFADDTFNRLIQSKKYSDAVNYADANMPPGARTADVWAQIGFANEQLGLSEKALASYIVGTRIDQKSYDSYLGIARIYNAMGRPDNVLTYAKKAMDIRPTSPGAASWEYAKACIAMKKPELAKEALEKVIEFDPRNAVANKGLAEIYWKDKAYEKAIPLLKMAYASEPNADDAYKIGKSLNEASKYDSAMYFLKDAVAKNPGFYPAALELAKAYYQKSKFLAAASEYEKLVGKTPFTAMDHFYRAASIEKTGNTEIALKAYRAAAEAFGAEKSPEAVTSHLKAGNADLEGKNYASALNHFLCVAAADSESNQVQDINFLLSEAYSGSGNIPKAIASLEKALADDKNNVEAYARLADLYQKNGQLDKAKQIFEKCITLKPNDPKIFLTLGEYNLKAKKYDEAITYFSKSYVIENSGVAAAGLASASFALGKMEKALDAAESALKLSPSLVEPRIVLYKCSIKNKNWAEARNQLNFLVDKKPLELEYWKSLAECCVQLKDSAHCADADKKISEMEKNNVPSRQRLGGYLLATRDYNKALGVYKELSSLTPQNAEVFKNLYTITNALGDKQAALGNMKKYCSLRPDDVTAQKYLGGVYYDLKNYDAALESFRKAIKQDPNVKGIFKAYAQIVISKGLNAEMQTAITGAIAAGEADGSMYKALAEFYQKQGLYDKAISQYQKASELDPRNVSLISALAKCNEKAGHLDEAAIFYGQALALNPSTVEDYKTLGALFVKRNKKPEAVDAFKKYLDKKLDNTAASFVADFAYSQKNYEEAARYYTLVSGPDAKNPELLYNFGQSCFNLKNLKKASELLNQLSSVTPKNPDLYKLLYQIALQDVSQKNAAADYLAKYLALKPTDASAQKDLGDILYEQKDAEGALRSYRKAISLDPGIKGIYKRYYELAVKKGLAADIDAALGGADKMGEVDAGMYVQLGALSEKKSAFPKALGYYLKAQQMDPGNTAISASIARCQIKSGNAADAIISYQQIVALNPKAVEEYKILGQLFLKENKPDLAMQEFKRYLAKKPEDSDISMLVAENAFKFNDYPETIKYLNSIQKEKSKDPNYLFLFGRACYYAGKYRNCVELLEQLQVLEKSGRKIKNPDRPLLLKMLAESYEKTGDKAKAAVVYAEITQSPDIKDPDVFFKMAHLQESISPLNAAKMFERNTLKFPKEYRNYYEAARLYSKQPITYEKATVLIKKCIAMKDTVAFLWQILGKMYGQMGKTALELDAYRKYIAKDTPNPDLCAEIGTSLLKRNKINESIVYLELASALSPENTEYIYQLAKGYEKTARIGEAIRLLKKANQINPGQEKIQTYLNYLLLKSGGKEN